MEEGFKAILLEVKEGVGRITMNRPPLNILNIETMQEIVRALESLRSDSRVKVVVIAAQGRAFSAGVEVREHTAEKVGEMVKSFDRIFHLLAATPQPTIALVQGAALGGGCELALFCDMVLASERAQFGQPEIKVGVFPPIAAIMLPRLIDRKRALELILTGESIDAQEAARLGLVNQVVPEDKLEETLGALLKKLTSLSGPVLRITKKAVYQGLDADWRELLERVDRIYLEELMATEDTEEGLRAFLEKRGPVWKER